MIATAQLSIRRAGETVVTSAVRQPVFTIGRLPSSDLVLPDSDVSQRHAEIRVEPEGLVLTDLGSETGTLLDGVRLLPLQPSLLRELATIRIGANEILYRMQPVLDDVTSPPALPENGGAGVAAFDSATEAEEPPFAARRGNASRAGPEVYAGKYLHYLPVIFHESDFLKKFLGIFEAIWEPLEQRQDHIAMYFDPRTCPVSWLPWLAGWFGMDVHAHWPESRMRALIAETAHLYRWRGTAYGLAHMVEVCTGIKPEIVQSSTERFVFRVVVRIPEHAPRDVVATIDALIMAHKPAHTGYVLEVTR